MKKENIKLNYIFNTGYQIFALLVPLITTPYISRILQADGIGTYSFTYSIVSYFMLVAALGTGTFGIRQLGIDRNDDYKRSLTFWNTYLLRTITSIISISFYIMYCFLFSSNLIISLLQGLYLVGVMLDVSWFFQGMENFGKVALRNILIKIINILFIFVFVKSHDDLWIYILGLTTLTIFGNLTMWFYLPKYIKKVKMSDIKPFSNIKDILTLFFPTVATQIYSIIDKSMIGLFCDGSVENGYYEQAEKIVKMCLVLITSLGTVMIPKISNSFKNNLEEEVKMYISKSYEFLWVLGIPMCIGLFFVSDRFVPVFFGEGFEKVGILLKILSLLFIFMGFNFITGNQYLISTNQQNKYTLIISIGGITNVIMNFILIPSLNSCGAAIASVLGEIVSILVSFLILRKDKYFRYKNIFNNIWKCVLAGIIMGIVLYLLDIYLQDSKISIGIMVIVASFIYFSVLIIFKETMIWNFIKKNIEKLKKINNE